MEHKLFVGSLNKQASEKEIEEVSERSCEAFDVVSQVALSLSDHIK